MTVNLAFSLVLCCESQIYFAASPANVVRVGTPVMVIFSAPVFQLDL